ncbi:UMP kinase [Candidatus Woesearchaeota archaeon]|nr:UMP kinase [Candidatus Woesearchaeota archaeon]
MKKFIISLGGSLIVPDEIDTDFLKKFRKIILQQKAQFVIIAGGGSTARKYQRAVKAVSGDKLESQDWIGISATHLNAFLLKCIFYEHAEKDIIRDPTKKFKFRKKIALAGGWKPGWSTDYDAVLMAKNIGADVVINMSNIDFVYDSDPNKNPDALPLKKISWHDFRKLVGDKWKPGLNMPFDPIAAKEAEKNKLKAIIIGKDHDNLEDVLEGRRFRGSTIANSI